MIKIKLANKKDAEFILKIMKDEETINNLPKQFLFTNLKETEDKLEKYKKMSAKKSRYFFIAFKNNKKIGFLDIYKISWENKHCSIGYAISKEFRKKGFASKLCKIGNDFIKNNLKLHAIEATINPKNIISKKVLKKNGFRKVGLMKDYYFENGVFVNRELYWKTLD